MEYQPRNERLACHGVIKGAPVESRAERCRNDIRDPKKSGTRLIRSSPSTNLAINQGADSRGLKFIATSREKPPSTLSKFYLYLYFYLLEQRNIYKYLLLDVDSVRCVISIFWCLGGWLERRVWINKEIRRLGLNEIIILSRMEG